jgi:hypothetical protein
VESKLGPLGTSTTSGLLCLSRVIARMENLVEWRLAGETMNPTWPDPGANSGRNGGKPATNLLCYGATFPRPVTGLALILHLYHLLWYLLRPGCYQQNAPRNPSTPVTNIKIAGYIWVSYIVLSVLRHTKQLQPLSNYWLSCVTTFLTRNAETRSENPACTLQYILKQGLLFRFGNLFSCRHSICSAIFVKPIHTPDITHKVLSSHPDFQLTKKVKVGVTLRLAVYRQSLHLGTRLLETHDQSSFPTELFR